MFAVTKAVQASSKAALATPAGGCQLSLKKLNNGLSVASIEKNGPLSHLVFVFRAGSRYENANQSGIVHHIRNFVGRDSAEYSGIELLWSSGLSGSSLRSFATREVFGLSMSVPRDQSALGLSILGQMAAQPAFKPWDLEDILPTLHADHAYRKETDYVFEDIHKAAFRNGPLSNSVYSAKRAIGKIPIGEFNAFGSKHFVSGNAALVAVNVDEAQLMRFAENQVPLHDGNNVQPVASPYKGGDWRRQRNINAAHVAIAGSGAAANDIQGVAVQSVLVEQLNRVLQKSSSKTSVSGFQLSYSDAGLVGVCVSHEDKTGAGGVVKDIVAALKKFDGKNLEDAKRGAINRILTSNDCSASAAVNKASHLLMTSGSGSGGESIIDAINKVKSENVVEAARKIAAKPSIASFGCIADVPYVDEL